MNWLDIVLLAILLLSTVASAWKGFSREIIGLAASLAALLGGIWFYASAAVYLRPYVSSPAVANVAGFFAIFLAVIILGWLVSAVVSRFLKTVGLSAVDRLLGAVFGFLRGVLVSVALLLAVVAFTGNHAGVENSLLAPYVMQASRVFAAVAPAELSDAFHRNYGELKAYWNGKR